ATFLMNPWSPDGKTVAITTDSARGQTVSLFAKDSDKPFQRLAALPRLTGGRWSPGGRPPAPPWRPEGGGSPHPGGWGGTSGKQLHLPEDTRTTKGFPPVWSPDGKRLVGPGPDNTAAVFDVNVGKQVQTLSGHSRPIECVLATPDGTTLISAGDDRAVHFWN